MWEAPGKRRVRSAVALAAVVGWRASRFSGSNDETGAGRSGSRRLEIGHAGEVEGGGAKVAQSWFLGSPDGARLPPLVVFIQPHHSSVHLRIRWLRPWRSWAPPGLTARMRPLENEMTTYRFAPFVLDARARRMTAHGNTEVPLPPKAMDVLICLLDRQGECVPKEDLVAAANGHFVRGYDGSLHQYIKTIRDALLLHAPNSYEIVNVRARGYRFDGGGAVVRDDGPEEQAGVGADSATAESPDRESPPVDQALWARASDGATDARYGGVGDAVASSASSLMRAANIVGQSSESEPGSAEEARHLDPSGVGSSEYPYRTLKVSIENELSATYMWSSTVHVVAEVVEERGVSSISHTNDEAVTAGTAFEDYHCNVTVPRLPASVSAHHSLVKVPSETDPFRVIVRMHFDPPLARGDVVGYTYAQSYKAIRLRAEEVDAPSKVLARSNVYYAGKPLAVRSFRVTEPTGEWSRTIALPVRYDPREIGYSVTFRGNLDVDETRRAGLGFNKRVEGGHWRISWTVEGPRLGYLYSIHWKPGDEVN